eukprot:2258406-Alexandrium_andersonii.AAC.1
MMRSQTCAAFRAAVAPLAFVFTAERRVEAQRAKTQRRARGSPFHSAPYMSLELRLPEIREHF